MRLHVLYYNEDGVRCERNEPCPRTITDEEIEAFIKKMQRRNKARK